MRCTVATIDADALRWNLSIIKKKAGPATVCAMVKANAYGHDIVTVARILQAEGVTWFGVAFADEAIVLRNNGITGSIILLTPHEPHEVETVLDYRLVPVICSIQQARLLAEKASERGVTASAHLYVDTGMHRDGIGVHEAFHALTEIDGFKGLRVDGVCMHFATADVLHHPFIQEQESKFIELLKKVADHGRTFTYVHASNTGALWQHAGNMGTMVRTGMSMYGYAQPSDPAAHLKPVMSLRSRVIGIRRIWPGDSVSYGQRFISTTETTICTVPIGYGDGYMRCLTGKAWCLIRGEKYPVVGTVCMDEIMVDVGNAKVTVGDEVVLIGTQANASGKVQSIDATDVAEWAGTIPYEITTAVSARVPRLLVYDGKGL
ncbi:MAG: Alanine racemase [Chlorobi bacterium]|nr:MAG: alanine racemase [Rhodocyclaceae bacterium]MBV6464635.1 Alanine racemase [Chlorobiota bacterium]MBZ0194179.1 alanine racemase [Candidatus Kapabacteria bacterium]MCC6331619.1 alanine racemase [Ignavibacteria bacterium]MCL4276842.1 alanine racemase [Ignavibacteria bacterium]